MRLVLLIIFSTSIALSNNLIMDKVELNEIKEFYNNTQPNSWYSKEISNLEEDFIYNDISSLESLTPNIKYVYDRDTLINNKEIDIYKFSKLDFERMIRGNHNSDLNLFNHTFSGYNYTRLKYLSFSELMNFKIPETFKADSLEVLKIYNSRLAKELDINQFNSLKVLDFFKILNSFDLTDINLPNCTYFSIIGCHIVTTLHINNLNSIDTFIIRDYFRNENDKQDPSTMYLIGTDPNELKKLSKVKKLVLGKTAIYGDLSEVEFDNIIHLDLHGNNFINSIPYINPKKIKHLNLKNNSFSKIDNHIESESLEYLDLSNNLFEQDIDIIYSPSLVYLDISRNKFSGNIRNLIGMKLEYFNASMNELSGELKEKIRIDFCYHFNVSDNKMTGNIPPIKSDKLIYLDFSENEFTNFTSDLELNERTILNISSNNIDPSEISKRCSGYTGSIENKIITSPDHIVEYSHQIEDSLFYKFTHFDVYSDVYSSIIYQNKKEINFNYATRRFDLSMLDTSLFEYVIFTYIDGKRVELNYKVWDQINEKRLYVILAISKYCRDFAFMYHSINLTELSINDKFVNCETIKAIEYFDLLGNKLNENNIYNKQVIVRYKCLETGKISHKLEIKER